MKACQSGTSLVLYAAELALNGPSPPPEVHGLGDRHLDFNGWTAAYGGGCSPGRLRHAAE